VVTGSVYCAGSPVPGVGGVGKRGAIMCGATPSPVGELQLVSAVVGMLLWGSMLGGSCVSGEGCLRKVLLLALPQRTLGEGDANAATGVAVCLQLRVLLLLLLLFLLRLQSP